MTQRLLAILLVLAPSWASAETTRPAWTPARPRPVVKRASVAAKPIAQQAQWRPVGPANTSPHLNWRDPGRTPSAEPAASGSRTVRGVAPLKHASVPPLGELPQRRTPVAARQDRHVRLVQGLEDLELPFPEAADADLLEDTLQDNPQHPAAPTPDDIFRSRRPAPQRPTRDAFRDQTPAQTAPRSAQPPERRALPGFRGDLRDASPPQRPATRRALPMETKPVQTPSRFETPPPASGDEVPNLEDLFEPLTNDTPAPAADPPVAAEGAPLTEATPLVESTASDASTDLGDEPPVFQPLADPVPQESTEPLPLPADNAPDFFGTPAAGTPVQGELTGTNNQDCEANAEACRADYELLRRRERTDISLDITPSIAPRELDMAKVDQARTTKLANAPSRTWTSRRGKVLTDGTLKDYRDGRVSIRTLNGSIRTFAPHELSDEDWCFVTAWWDIPAECRFEHEEYVVRDFRMTTFTWTAPSTCHRPLYFEEVALERYGHTAGPVVQPLVSGAHFFGNIVMLPYHMGLNPPNECMYTLGHYRPGSCAPWLVHAFPFTTRGIKWQGLALGAAIALLP